jgi:hypothetical protein
MTSGARSRALVALRVNGARGHGSRRCTPSSSDALEPGFQCSPTRARTGYAGICVASASLEGWAWASRLSGARRHDYSLQNSQGWIRLHRDGSSSCRCEFAGLETMVVRNEPSARAHMLLLLTCTRGPFCRRASGIVLARLSFPVRHTGLLSFAATGSAQRPASAALAGELSHREYDSRSARGGPLRERFRAEMSA